MQSTIRVFSLLILLMAGWFVSPVSAQKWVKFQEDACKCKIKFPSAPDVTTDAKEDATTHKAVAQVGDQTFFFGYTAHEVTMVEHENMAQISLDAFNEQLAGNVVGDKPWEIKKNVGRQATINLQDQAAVCLYKVILIGQMQYQLVVISPLESLDKEGADTFFNSFKPKKK